MINLHSVRILPCFLTAFILTVAFSSCQREVDFLEENNDELVYIKSAVSLDTTKAVGLDTISKSMYVYDASKRLQHSYWTYYSYPGGVLTKSTINKEFLYGGASRYPSNILGHYVSGEVNGFLFYNANNESVRDSTIFANSPGVYTMAVRTQLPNGSFQQVRKQHNIGWVSDNDSSIYRRTILNGNVTGGYDSTYMPSGFFRVVYAYTYDDKRNPYEGLAYSYPMFGNYFFSPDVGSLPGGKNNALTYSETYQDASTTAVTSGTVNYSYRADGMPSIGRVTGSWKTNKIIFTYY